MILLNNVKSFDRLLHEGRRQRGWLSPGIPAYPWVICLTCPCLLQPWDWHNLLPPHPPATGHFFCVSLQANLLFASLPFTFSPVLPRSSEAQTRMLGEPADPWNDWHLSVMPVTSSEGTAINECQASISFSWILLVTLKAFKHTTWLTGWATSVDWSVWQIVTNTWLPTIRREREREHLISVPAWLLFLYLSLAPGWEVNVAKQILLPDVPPW